MTPTLSSTLGRLRAPRAIAAAAAVMAAVALPALSRAPGVSGEEAALLGPLLAGPDGGRPTAGPWAGASPPLAPLAARAALAAAPALGGDLLAASRLPSALSAALLAALVALLAAELAGPVAAVLAPALLLCAPRLLAPFLHAGPRPLGAALLVAAALAYRRAAAAATAAGRVRGGGAAGVLLGLAVATQLEAILLVAVLAVHAGLVRLLRPLEVAPTDLAVADPTAPLGPAARIEARLRGVPVVATLAVIAPAVAFALWPGLWPDPPHRLAGVVRGVLSPRPPWAGPVVTTALALPAALAGAGAVGLLHTLLRLGRALRGAPGLSDELFLLLGVAWPFAAAQLGLGVPGPGLSAWLAAFPFLAVISARAVIVAARVAWPAWAARATWALAALTGALVVAASVVATLHAWPQPGAAWGELAGGAPGAASLGRERQEGDAVATILGAVSARARPGARVHLAALPANALTVYQATGRLRADLVPVANPEEADLALVPLDGGARTAEYRVWAAFGTATPVEGVFLDEVPLAWVYARPGAWR